MRNRVLTPARLRAGRKTARRQLDSRAMLPPGIVNTRSSGCLPAMNADISRARNRGTGTVRDWCDFGVPRTTWPPTSENARLTSILRRARSMSQTRSAVASPTAGRYSRAARRVPALGGQVADLVVSQEDVIAVLYPG